MEAGAEKDMLAQRLVSRYIASDGVRAINIPGTIQEVRLHT